MHPLCILIPVEETVPIYPFDFGKEPFSDICSNILVECILEESLLSTNLWNLLQQDEVLFKITADPQSVQDLQSLFDESMVNTFII